MSSGATLPPLILPFKGDIKGIQTAFTQVNAMGKKFATGFAAPMQQARASVASFGSTLTGFVAPIAAAATAWASFSSIMTAFERAETLSKTAEGLGTTVSALDKLNYAAKLSSSSTQELEQALRKMNVFLGSAAEGADGAEDTLRKLGLTTKDFEGMSSDEAFLRMSDALNQVGSQGERAKIGMEVFGKGANKIATLSGQGSAAIKALGDEGERLGRTLSELDVAKLMQSKDSMEKMGTAFESLAARAAVALSPLFNFITNAINDWVGDTRRFDETFNSMAKGVVVAIGTIKMVWQGLQLLWEGSKAVIYTIGEIFADVARGITKAALWISHVASGAWEELKLRFSVVADALILGWKYVKAGALLAFASIEEAFGKSLRAMGEAASNSRIKGLADVGRSAQEAGAELIVGSVKITQGVKEELAAANTALGTSMAALKKAQDDYASTPIDTSTPYLDAVSAGYKKLAIESVDAMRQMSKDILAQDGGNAISDMLTKYEKKRQEFEDTCTKIAAEGSAKRAVITGKEMNEYEKYLSERSKRAETAELNIFKATVDAAEKKQLMMDKMFEYNQQLMAQQEAAAVEWENTSIARENAAHLDKIKRRKAAQEELNALKLDSDAELEARTEEMRLQYAKADDDAAKQRAAQWKSGWQGKMDVAGDFFGQMATLMDSGNRKLFEIGKASAIAQTIVSTFQGAQAAFTSFASLGPVGVAAGVAAAGAAVAAGMARVASIRSTTFGSTGGGGGGGGGGSSTSTGSSSQAATNGGTNGQAAAASPTNVNIALQGQSFSSEQIRSLISAINDAGGDNMNIKTVTA